MEDEKYASLIVGFIGGLPILAVLTNHPVGYLIGITWGFFGWLLVGDAFSDYKKMKDRVEELEKEKAKKK